MYGREINKHNAITNAMYMYSRTCLPNEMVRYFVGIHGTRLTKMTTIKLLLDL